MAHRIHQELAILAESGTHLGEIHFKKTAPGYTVRHWLDAEVEGLEVHAGPDAAIEIAKYTAEGQYRPLKTAPTLRRGWRLDLADVPALALALDFFYPAMLGSWLAWREKRLEVTSLRDTVNRQTGMYRITGKITTEQAQNLVGTACAAGNCRKTILWPVEPGQASPDTLPEEKLDPALDIFGPRGAFVPLMCQEPCNILVAAAREVVKKAAPPPVS